MGKGTWHTRGYMITGTFYKDALFGRVIKSKNGLTFITEVLNSVKNGKETNYENHNRIENTCWRAGARIAVKEVEKEQAFFGREMIHPINGPPIFRGGKVMKALDKDWQSYTALKEGK